MRTILPIAFLAAIIAGCQAPLPDDARWSGSLQMYGGRSLSLELLLDHSPQPTAWLVVGDEHTLVPEVMVRGDSVILTFAEYGAAIRAAWDGARLNGFYERYRRDTLRIPWSARPAGAQVKVHASTPPAVALVGSFRVFYQRDAGFDTLSSATFWARGDSIFGSFVAADGDLGLFAGIQRGDSVVLDRFNGWQALKLELKNEGRHWTGQLFSRDLRPTDLRLEARPEAAPVLPADRVASPVDPKARFQFSGVTPEGEVITESSSRFNGKALIVDIMGTWCHNCMDAAPILQRIAQEYRSRGLEVVALSFELSDDSAAGRRNLAIYRKKYGLDFTLLFCGSTDATYTDPALRRQIKNFGAYPTTLFIDRRGRIEDIHVGFRGPGAGAAYQREIELLYRKAEELTGR
ncbi:MAG: TlpA family protein disulfide reductase [Bacteroidetes bacterium]|jgi:thiol-disulfide isomerase/thioredoxin|nr:TlpA family protein disulfide reductase [Bacteroidota bacterium]